ncbi:MAG TPA: hypothetical protein VJ839_07375 [Candidatus Limnocylindria bacterium]|nr:hypothetical protein [Candidatus Limnocylindria bacterium]
MDVPAIPISIGAQITERDLALQHVRSAIDLILAGEAQRVTLIGFPDAERLLPIAQAMSAEAGLTARAVWPSDGTGCDIAFEVIR